MADSEDPPQDADPNADPPPDPNATQIAEANTRATEAEARLTEANTQVAAALEATRTALQTANPGLPASAFTGDTFEVLNANIQQAQSVEAHVREQIKANPAGHPPPASGTTRTTQMPDNLRGINKIAFALNNPGPGMTE